MRASDRMRIAIVPLLACCVSLVFGGNAEPFPYRMIVSVEWGRPLGPESFRAELQQRIVAEISAQGCFREVDGESPESLEPDDLRLRLFIDDFEQETDFEIGVAQRNNPEYDTGRSMVAHLDADFHAQVQTSTAEASVRDRRFHQRSSWRPLYREDPRVEAQRKMIAAVARATRKFACKGSAADWSRQIEQAGGQAPR
jgi:hypothetical protein